MSPRTGELAGNARFLALKSLLLSTGGLTVDEIRVRFGVSRASVYRDVTALRAAGDAVEEERDGKEVRLRMMRRPGQDGLVFTTAELIALFVALCTMHAFAGTGFDADLKSVFDKIGRQLSERDRVTAQNLARKFHDVNEAPRLYSERSEDVDDLVTGLVNEEELVMTHKRVGGGKTAFTFHPYSLLIYKKGLYVAGFSSHKGAVMIHSLDGILSVERKRGEKLEYQKFEYPEGYHPEKLLEGRWGLFDGPSTKVVLHFSERVRDFVERRLWHPSQEFTVRKNGSLEMAMTVKGLVELSSWVLGFGKQVEVVTPPSFREEIAGELEAALGMYRGRPASGVAFP